MFKSSRSSTSSPFHITSIAIAIFLAITPTVRSDPINRSGSRKLDEFDQSKCGSCPCGTTCTTPIVYSSPPPPSLPPPPPPPKTPKASSSYCPPPPPSPSSNFIYYMGPPGNLYPVDQNYNSGFISAATIPAVVGGALIALFMLW